MRKVSVIVPVYNTQKELGRCLYSIQNQTYKNLEIICIDDGSTDGSEDIVDIFAKEDKRFTVVHQKNMGESGARNVGLKIATGDIIAFCDCDDWIESDTYEALMKEMDQYDLDISAGGWMKETSKGAEKIYGPLQRMFLISCNCWSIYTSGISTEAWPICGISFINGNY